MVLEAVVAGVPDGVVQPGRALERRLAVERRVDPAGQHLGGRERRGLEPAGAELQQQLGLGDLVGGREPAALGGRRGQLDVHRDFGLDVAERGHHPPDVARRVVEVAHRDLEAGEVQAELRAEADRAGELAGAAGDDHRQRAAEAADQRQVGVLQHEGADQLGAVLGRARGVRRRGLVEGSITGREDRGIVDQTGPRIVEWHPTNVRDMAHYRAVGDVPPKRHTQHRDPDGKLYREELMGEEGFSSDSSLLYHRGVPSAIVASEIWELPDQTRTPNHPLKPRHLKLHELATDKDAQTMRSWRWSGTRRARSGRAATWRPSRRSASVAKLCRRSHRSRT